MSSGVGMMKSGGYIGTGAEIEIPLPFNPKFVKITSVTEIAVTEMSAEMPDATGLQTVYSNGTDPASIAMLDADGITLGQGKFTVGADANINTADSEYYWQAWE